MRPESYYLYSLLATIVGFSLTLISLLFVYAQIVAGRKSRETDVLIRLYQISTQEPLSADFDIVWDLKTVANLSDKQQAACMRACIFFEMVGSITSQKYMNTLLIEEFFGSLVTGSYEALKPYIEMVRLKPYNNKFAINFERLAISLARSERISKAPSK